MSEGIVDFNRIIATCPNLVPLAEVDFRGSQGGLGRQRALPMRSFNRDKLRKTTPCRFVTETERIKHDQGSRLAWTLSTCIINIGITGFNLDSARDSPVFASGKSLTATQNYSAGSGFTRKEASPHSDYTLASVQVFVQLTEQNEVIGTKGRKLPPNRNKQPFGGHENLPCGNNPLSPTMSRRQTKRPANHGKSSGPSLDRSKGKMKPWNTVDDVPLDEEDECTFVFSRPSSAHAHRSSHASWVYAWTTSPR